MASLQSTNSDSMLSDFSSTLLNVGAKNQDTGDTIVNISSSQYGSADNSNLSSVLSQIQDDGPAYNESIKRDNLSSRNMNTDHNASADSTNQQNQRHNPDAIPEGSSAQFSEKQRRITNANNYRNWIQLSLIILIGIAAIYTFIKFDARTSDLEQALNVYDDDLQESIESQDESILPEINKINDVIKSVKKELQVIKTDYLALDKKYETAIEIAIEDALLDKTASVTVEKNNVSHLENENMLLKKELAKLKNKLDALNENRSPATKTTANNTLTVNLASLTNEEKAEKLVEKLSAAGLTPSIQSAVVNDQRVYRISVSGFADLDAAKLFLRTADKQYGMKDSWIRKS